MRKFIYLSVFSILIIFNIPSQAQITLQSTQTEGEARPVSVLTNNIDSRSSTVQNHIFALGSEARYEKQDSTDFEALRTLKLIYGKEFLFPKVNEVWLKLEYSRNSEATSSGYVSVENQYNELLLMAEKFSKNNHYYIGFGWGLGLNQVSIQIEKMKQQFQSELNSVLAAELGMQYSFDFNLSSEIQNAFVAAETRAYYSEAFAPNAIVAIGLKLGMFF